MATVPQLGIPPLIGGGASPDDDAPSIAPVDYGQQMRASSSPSARTEVGAPSGGGGTDQISGVADLTSPAGPQPKPVPVKVTPAASATLAPPDPAALRSILDPIPVDRSVKHDAWDAYHQASTKDEFKAQFDKLALPTEAKRALWDLKFPVPVNNGVPASVILPGSGRDVNGKHIVTQFMPPQAGQAPALPGELQAPPKIDAAAASRALAANPPKAYQPVPGTSKIGVPLPQGLKSDAQIQAEAPFAVNPRTGERYQTTPSGQSWLDIPQHIATQVTQGTEAAAGHGITSPEVRSHAGEVGYELLKPFVGVGAAAAPAWLIGAAAAGYIAKVLKESGIVPAASPQQAPLGPNASDQEVENFASEEARSQLGELGRGVMNFLANNATVKNATIMAGTAGLGAVLPVAANLPRVAAQLKDAPKVLRALDVASKAAVPATAATVGASNIAGQPAPKNLEQATELALNALMVGMGTVAAIRIGKAVLESYPETLGEPSPGQHEAAERVGGIARIDPQEAAETAQSFEAQGQRLTAQAWRNAVVENSGVTPIVVNSPPVVHADGSVSPPTKGTAFVHPEQTISDSGKPFPYIRVTDDQGELVYGGPPDAVAQWLQKHATTPLKGTPLLRFIDPPQVSLTNLTAVGSLGVSRDAAAVTEPVAPTTPETPPAAPGEPAAAPEPQPATNADAYKKALDHYNKLATDAAQKYLKENPGATWADAERATAGTYGVRPDEKDFAAPPAPPAPPEPAAKPTPPSNVERVSPATPNPPTAALPTEPESPETIALQMQQLREGTRKVVMFPKGQGQSDATFQPGEPIAITHDEFGNTYAFRTDKINRAAITTAARNNTLPEILGGPEGMGAPDKSALQGPPVAVVAKGPDGTEAQTTVTDAPSLPQTVAATQHVVPPGGTLEVKTPEEALAERQGETPEAQSDHDANRVFVNQLASQTDPLIHTLVFEAVTQNTPDAYSKAATNVARWGNANANSSAMRVAGILKDLAKTAPEPNAQPSNQEVIQPNLNAKLPHDLAGAKPRYSYGPKQFELNFLNDIDRAAYIAAQETPSRRDADYLKFAMDATGADAGAIRAHGLDVRNSIKAAAKNATNPVITVLDHATKAFGQSPQVVPSPIAPAQPSAAVAPEKEPATVTTGSVGRISVADGPLKSVYPHAPLWIGSYREGAEPVLDLNKKPTGWLQMEDVNGGVLIHPTEDRVISFTANDRSSGSDLLRAKVEAQNYAIEHPVVQAQPPAPSRGSTRATNDAIGRIDAALLQVAQEKAAAENNKHMQTLLRAINLKNMSPADRDSLNAYLGIPEGTMVDHRNPLPEIRAASTPPGPRQPDLLNPLGTPPAPDHSAEIQRLMSEAKSWQRQAAGQKSMMRAKSLAEAQKLIDRAIALSQATARAAIPTVAPTTAPYTHFTGSTNAALENRAAEVGDIGLMVTPLLASYKNSIEKYPVVAIDNGVFSKTQAFSPARFRSLIRDIAKDPAMRAKVRFVVAPDVVGDAKKTLEQFPEWAAEIHGLGLPVAFAAQDGIEDMLDQIPWNDFEVLFIGGSTDWKIGRDASSNWYKLLRAATEHNKPIHVGRVNSMERMEIAHYGMGASSGDGTGPAFHPERTTDVIHAVDRVNSGDFNWRRQRNQQDIAQFGSDATKAMQGEQIATNRERQAIADQQKREDIRQQYGISTRGNTAPIFGPESINGPKVDELTGNGTLDIDENGNLKVSHPPLTGWIGSQSPERLEAIRGVMRDIFDEAERARAAHQAEVKAMGNRIPVGGAHMDSLFRAEALEAFSRAIWDGKGLQQAVDYGNSAANEAVKKWNEHRAGDYVVHRALNGERPHLEEMARRVANAGGITKPYNSTAWDVSTAAEAIFNAMKKSEFSPGATVTFSRMRQENPEIAAIPKDIFDRAALKLQENRRALLAFHDHADSLPEAERKRFVQDETGRSYVSIYDRNPQDSSDALGGARATYPPAPIPGVQTTTALEPWFLGQHEGQPVTPERLADISDRIKNRPDEAVTGRGPRSVGEGESFNQFKDPLIGHVQNIVANYRPGERILNVTHYRDIQAVKAWLKAGAPADRSIDTAEMVRKGDQEPGGLYYLDPDAIQRINSGSGKVSPADLKSVQKAPGDGIYFLRHGATEWNAENKGPSPNVGEQPGNESAEVFRGSSNIDLAPQGIEEAESAARRTAGEFTKIYASPLKRAQDTAAVVVRMNPQVLQGTQIGAGTPQSAPATLKQVEDAAFPPTAEDAPAGQPPHITLANAVLRKLQSEESIGNNAALQQIADVAYGGTRASGAYALKEAHDAVEAAVNRYIADSIGRDLLTGDFHYAMGRLREILAGLPTQNARTDEQVSLQQFSTPPTLAFFAAKVAAMLPRDTVLEPSAGTAGLAAWAKASGAIVKTNEIDARRRELMDWALRTQSTGVDAEILNSVLPTDIQPTVVLMNPPFSSTGGRVAHNSNEVGFKHVINALSRLQLGGRLVAILGEGARFDAPTAAQFWRDIAKRGGLLRANIGISGKEYTKYGTTFGNRLIVIDKAVDFTEQHARPASLMPRLLLRFPISGDFDTIEEAYDAIQPIIRERRVLLKSSAGESALAEGGGELPTGAGGGPVLSGEPGGTVRTPERGSTGTQVPGRGTDARNPSAPAGQSGINTGNAPAAAPAETGGRPAAGDAGTAVGGAFGAAGINPQSLIDKLVEQLRGEAPASAPVPPISATEGAKILQSGRGGKLPNQPAPAPAPKATPLDAAAAQALQELNDMLGLTGKGPLTRPRDVQGVQPINPAIMERLALVGAQSILRGSTGYTDWTRDMVEQAAGILAAVSAQARMSGEDLLREIHGVASAVARQLGVEAEPTPPAMVEDESIVQPPREDDRVSLEAQKQEDLLERVEDDGQFVQYVPAIQGLAHPGVVVESKVMASVSGPEITYRPNLPATEIANSPKPLSAVQMEAIARAGQSHETFNEAGERLGILISDSTGLGKGQEIAGIIWDNNRSGRKRALWLSGSADLIDQAKGDFIGIGATELSKQLHPISDWQTGTEIDAPEGVLFSTYTTLAMEAKGNAVSRLQQIMNWLGPDGVIIFDEAAKGKNAVPGEQQDAGSKAGKAVIAIQRELPKARVAYVSATAATEVRNIGYMTRLNLWGRGTPFPTGFQQFMAEVGSGGIAAMELIARELKAAGRFLSRSISYKGVSFEEKVHELTSDQERIYDSAAQAWQDVLQSALDQVDENGGSERQKRAVRSGIWGEHQRFFRALLTAMKTPTLFEMIDKAMNDPDDPRAIIVSLIGTGETQGKRQLAQVTDDNDELDFSPREILENYIRKSYPIHLMEEYTDPETGETGLRYVTDAEGKKVENPEAKAKRDAWIKKLRDELALPESPLDQIISNYGRDQVAEITARKKTIRRNPDTGKWEAASRAPDGVKLDDINKYEMNQFQDGKKNILVMSKAGGTGFSFHADLSRNNQRRRLQIALELSWSADDQTQAFGRSHRSNQRVTPEFVILSTNAGGEKRFSSSVARRLESLGALSKGQRDASGGSSVLAKYNFETDQGIQAANSFYSYLLQDPEIPGSEWNGLDILRKMGVLNEPVDEHGQPTGAPPSVSNEVRQNVKRLLNRILNVQIRAQNGVYELFTNFFDEAVQAAIEDGRLDTGVNLVRGDHIRLLESRVIATDPNTKAKTYRYIVEVERKNKPVSVEVVRDLAERGRGHMMRRRENHGDSQPDQLIWVERSTQPITTRSGNVERAYRYFGPGHRENAREYKRISESDLNNYYEPMEGADLVQKLKNADQTVKILNDIIALENPSTYRGPLYYQNPMWNAMRKEKFSDTDKEQLEGYLKKEKGIRKDILDEIKAAKEGQWDEWQSAYDAVPPGRTDRIDMIGGSVMRVWSYLNVGRGRMDIRIAYPDSGGSITGVVMSEGDANAVEHALTGNTTQRTPESVFRAALAGTERFSLAGGIRMQQSRINRDPVIQLITSDPYNQRFFTTAGVRKETVNYQAKYYIPNDPKVGVPIMEKILKQFPVMNEGRGGALARPRATPGESAGPIWYSQLERAIENKMPAKASPAQVAAIIGNPQNGVKADEVKWTGIRDWLQEQKGMVTKDQVLDFVRSNAVQVQEVLRGGPNDYSEQVKKVNQLIRRYDALRAWPVWRRSSQDRLRQIESQLERYEAELKLERAKRDAMQDVPQSKYKQYTIPGGREYGELLMKLPSRTRPEFDPGDSYTSSHWDNEPNVIAHIRFNSRKAPDGKKVFHIEEIQSDWHQAGRTKGYRPSGEERAELQRQLADAEAAFRKTADARSKALDAVKYAWPQDGTPELTRAEVNEWDALSNKLGRQHNLSPHEMRRWQELRDKHNAWEEAASAQREKARAEYAVAEKAKTEAYAKYDALRKRLHGGVPDAPFAKTWPELAFKRALRWAVENGYDRVSWTNGETQADRYDLSKQVSSVQWEPFAIDGEPESGKLVAFDKNGSHVISTVMDRKDIPDYIGKDVARKLLETEPDSTGTHILYGNNLRVGGQGMHEFYDEMLPRYAAKLGAKWGAKVGTGEIDAGKVSTPGRYEGPEYTPAQLEKWRWEQPGISKTIGDQLYKVYNAMSSTPDRIPGEDQPHGLTFTEAMNRYGSLTLARALGGDFHHGKPALATAPVHTIDITPAMTDSVLAGQPLFRPRTDLMDDRESNGHDKADAVYEALVPGQPGHVYMNKSGTDLIADALGETPFWGVTLEPHQVDIVKDVLRGSRKIPELRQSAKRLMNAIEDAENHNRSLGLKNIVTVVDAGPGTSVKEIQATRREEAFHRWQVENGLAGDGGYTDLDIAQIPEIADALDRIGAHRLYFFTERKLVELGAMLATGQGADLGYSREQAADVLRKYIDGLIKANGPEAGTILKAVNPQVRKDLGKEYVAARWNGNFKGKLFAKTGRSQNAGGVLARPARSGAVNATGEENGPGAIAGSAQEIEPAGIERGRNASEPAGDEYVALRPSAVILPANKLSSRAGQFPALNDLIAKAATMMNPTAPEGPQGERHFHDPNWLKRKIIPLQRAFLPGRNQLEVRAASREIYNAANMAGSSRGTASVLSQAIPLIINTLKGTGISVIDLFSAYQESRLRAIAARYVRWGDEINAMDDQQVQEAYGKSFGGGESTLMKILDELDPNLPGEELSQWAAMYVARGDWAGLRALSYGAMLDASDQVVHTMPAERYDQIKQAIKTPGSGAEKADFLYHDLIEKEIEASHARHDGVFAEDNGDLGRYFPLMRNAENDVKMAASRDTPWRPPKNMHNRMAMGMSSTGYTADLPTLHQFIAGAMTDSDRNGLIKTMVRTGWLVPVPDKWDGLVKGPDGISYKAARPVTLTPSRLIVKDGDAIPTGAIKYVMPQFMYEGLKPILDDDRSEPADYLEAMHEMNMVSTKLLPFELVNHANGYYGAMYGNVPFIAGDTAMEKVLMAPILRYFTIRYKMNAAPIVNKMYGKQVLSDPLDPSTPENIKILTKISKLGALASRSGSVTYSKDIAEATGAKLEKGWGPLLYGPNGLDARARILMYKLATADGAQHIPDEVLGDIINQLGNYNSWAQGAIEQALKRSSLNVFVTAHMTRLVNGIHAATGTGPIPPGQSRALLMAQRAFMVHLLVPLLLYVLAYYAMTNRVPWKDPRFKMGDIPVGGGDGWIDKYRHSQAGNWMWGNGSEVGYIHFLAVVAPLISRVMPKQAIDRWVHDASFGQVVRGLATDATNVGLGTVLGGPTTRMMIVATTGHSPYITDWTDKSGTGGLQFMSAIPKEIKPGFLGGFAPALASGYTTKHFGDSARAGAQIAAALKELSSTVAAVGGGSGTLGEDERKGSIWARLAASLLFPGIFGTSSNPYASNNYLMQQKRALADMSLPAALKTYEVANQEEKQAMYRTVRDKVYAAKVQGRLAGDDLALAHHYFNVPMPAMMSPQPIGGGR